MRVKEKIYMPHAPLQRFDANNGADTNHSPTKEAYADLPNPGGYYLVQASSMLWQIYSACVCIDALSCQGGSFRSRAVVFVR
jgi:hypothetical protein